MGGGGDIISDVGDFFQETVIDPISDLGSEIDDFVNEEIPGGWYTVGAAAGASLLGPELLAAEGEILGTGAEIGSIAEGMSGAEALGSGITAGATGEGLVAPTVPSLSTMGGGTGLVTEAAGGGLLSGAGVTAAGAVPILGSAGSFINNPSVIGNPVVGYSPAPAFSLQDAFRGARLASNLFARPQAPQVNPYQLMQQNSQLSGSVDYAPTLNLLATRPPQNPYSLV